MEFNEKLQELRKSKGLTQEELASILYVSRTAISKWESGRGTPSIDSLKEISHYFSISIDDLLSTEKLLNIAEKENKSNIKKLCHYLFGIVDICTILLILLPLYPNIMNEFIISVNLFEYSNSSSFSLVIYWISYLLLILIGIIKIVLTEFEFVKINQIITFFSILISSCLVLYLGITRIAYAIVLSFILLLIKVFLMFRIK